MQHHDFLCQYGVLGMKWGVRRGRKSSSKASKTRTKKEEPKKKSISEMSDDDLRKVVNRMNLEKQYAQAMAVPKSKAKAFVTDVLRDAAKETAKAYTAKYMKAGVAKLETAILGTKPTK